MASPETETTPTPTNSENSPHIFQAMVSIIKSPGRHIRAKEVLSALGAGTTIGTSLLWHDKSTLGFILQLSAGLVWGITHLQFIDEERNTASG